jgi:undecaprenyl-diphosphatase
VGTDVQLRELRRQRAWWRWRPRRGRAWWRWRRVRLPDTLVLLETGAIALALTVFLVLGRMYAAEPLVGLDVAGLGLGRALRSPSLDAVVETATRLGADALWYVWPPLVLLLVLLRRLPSAAAISVVALGVHTWNDVLKSIYQRSRPTDLEGVLGVQAFSFPSGHAMAAGAIFGILALIAWRELRGRWRWVAIAACVAVAVGVAFSRVYLGVHYPTDVLAGLLAGALWADLVVLIWRLAARLAFRSVSSREAAAVRPPDPP